MSDDQIINKTTQLRVDKVIYACEAIAVTSVCIFGYLLSNQYLSGLIKDGVNWTLLLVAVSYTVYMGVGNKKRRNKIQELERSNTHNT